MIKTVDDYLDAARARAGLPSDRQLAKAMGVDATSVNQWRTKRAWPADRQMVRLAELAGADPKIALLQLNTWRTKSPEAREHYSHIAALVSRAGLVALFTVGLLPGVLEGYSGTKTAQNDAVASASTYYGKFEPLAPALRRKPVLTGAPNACSHRNVTELGA